MKTWKRFVAINVGALIGIGLSIFLVPPDTPFWLWAIIATVAIAALNFFLYRSQRKSLTNSKMGPLPAIIGWIGTALFLLELILHFVHR